VPHLTGACILNLLPWWTGGVFLQRRLKGDSTGDSPAPNQDPALSARVTTGDLSAPISRWKARCHLLWIHGSWPPVHAPVLGINVEEPWGAMMAEKQKIIFLLDSGTHFSVLPFSPVPQSKDKSCCSGEIWPVPRMLIYPASGLLLGRPPLLSLFPHSFWNSSDSAGMGFTISTKSSNSPPLRQLCLLSPPLGTSRFHSVDWWDECKVSQDGHRYSNKAQKSLTVSSPKTISPQAWGTMRPYAYHKFLKTPQATN
jgi:hypothetical protein